ncbi:hypothetical protein HA402_006994 [Bradysia odoriphaga]|nr:hypothetical protein HA402_006994 [Bradysia odoriphaga]
MIILLILMVLGVSVADVHRSKRYLVFPPTAPTRVQIIGGIGIPVDLDYESVTLGYVLKAEYFLPDNTNLTMHFMQDPFNPITRPVTSRRKRSSLTAQPSKIVDEHKIIGMQANQTNSSTVSGSYEKYDIEAVEIDRGNDTSSEDSEYFDDFSEDEDKVYTAADYRISKPNDFATARWSLFKGIEMLAERSGLVGRPCMLRSICESAQAPFTFKSGILGELMHIIMTPSSTKDKINDHSQNEYLRAEEFGRSGAPCEKIFKECPKSLLNQFTGIYGSMENIIKLIG